MDDSIRLSEEQRKELLTAYRYGKDARVSRRAHIVLLLAEGWTYREVRVIAFASFDLIRDCVRELNEGGLAAVLGKSFVAGCHAVVHAALYRPGTGFRGAEGD